MRFVRHTNEWWQPTSLAPNKPHVPKRLNNIDPASSDEQLKVRRTGKIGAFSPSYKWKPYGKIEGYDAGYLTKLYSLKEIADRYGLSQNSRKYFKKHLLPEPFDIVRRRSVSAHHWSLFTLMVMDVVLRDLEGKGYSQFLKSFDEHLENLHYGADWLEHYYAEKYESQLPVIGDKYGVSWG